MKALKKQAYEVKLDIHESYSILVDAADDVEAKRIAGWLGATQSSADLAALSRLHRRKVFPTVSPLMVDDSTRILSGQSLQRLRALGVLIDEKEDQDWAKEIEGGLSC